MFFSGSAQVEKGFLCRALADIPLPVVLASLTRSLSNANIPPNTKEENTVSKIQLQYDSLAWDPSACALTETYKMEKRQNMFFFGNLNLDMFQIGSSAKYSRDEFVFQRCGFEAQDGGEWGGGGDARGRCVTNHPYLHDLHKLRNSASSFHWLSSSIFNVWLVVRPASVTSPLISTIWCFRPYKPFIFCEDMILATCQCHHCWVEPSLLLSISSLSSI